MISFLANLCTRHDTEGVLFLLLLDKIGSGGTPVADYLARGSHVFWKKTNNPAGGKC